MRTVLLDRAKREHGRALSALDPKLTFGPHQFVQRLRNAQSARERRRSDL